MGGYVRSDGRGRDFRSEFNIIGLALRLSTGDFAVMVRAFKKMSLGLWLGGISVRRGGMPEIMG